MLYHSGFRGVFIRALVDDTPWYLRGMHGFEIDEPREIFAIRSRPAWVREKARADRQGRKLRVVFRATNNKSRKMVRFKKVPQTQSLQATVDSRTQSKSTLFC